MPTANSTTGPRTVLASGICLGIAMVLALAVDRPHMLAANFEVYQLAAQAALAGDNFYTVASDRFPHFYYLYPPITLITFVPFVVVDLWTGFVLHTLFELFLALSLAWVIVRWISHYRSLSRLDHLLIVGFVVASIHTVPSLFYGQVNLRMAFLFGLGLYVLDRSHSNVHNRSDDNVHNRSDSRLTEGADDTYQRTDDADDTHRRPWNFFRNCKHPTHLETLAGVALAGAALLKVFPAAIGLWLVRVRAWWTLAGAVVTGVGGIVCGVAIFGLDTTRTYFLTVLIAEADADAFAGGLDPMEPYVTVQRPLSILLPELGSGTRFAVAAVVLALPLAYIYSGSTRSDSSSGSTIETSIGTNHEIHAGIDRLVALHATVLAIFLFVPSYPLYYVLLFPTLVPTLYLVTDRLSRSILIVGALFANVVVLGPTLVSIAAVLPPSIGNPFLSGGLTLLTVASPVLLGCLLMLVGCVLYRYRRL